MNPAATPRLQCLQLRTENRNGIACRRRHLIYLKDFRLLMKRLPGGVDVGRFGYTACLIVLDKPPRRAWFVAAQTCA